MSNEAVIRRSIEIENTSKIEEKDLIIESEAEPNSESESEIINLDEIESQLKTQDFTNDAQIQDEINKKNIEFEENNEKKSPKNIKKSVLTKITQHLSSKIDNKKKISVYDYLVHDEYIKRFSEKFNNNKPVINNFLERTKEHKIKKYFNEHEQKIEKIDKTIGSATNNKINIKSNSRNFIEFIDEQKQFLKNKENRVNYMKSLKTKELDRNIYSSPKINELSRKIASKRSGSSINIYEKLSKIENKPESEQASKKSILLKKEKENTSKTSAYTRNKSMALIESASTRVPKEKTNTRSTEKIKNDNNEKEILFFNSNLVILEKFIINYELGLFNMTNEKSHVPLTKELFINLLQNLGFVQNYKNDSKSFNNQQNSKLNQINKKINEAWDIITENNQKETNSDKLFVFLISVLGLYSGETEGNEEHNKKILDSKILKKIIPEIDFNKYGYPSKIVQQIKSSFREFAESRTNFIMNNKKINHMNKLKNDIEDFSFSPKTNNTSELAMRYRENIIKNVNKSVDIKEFSSHKKNTYSQIESSKNVHCIQEIYNINKLNKINSLAKIKTEKENQALKECTFKPKILNKAKSTVNVEERLYEDLFKRQEKQEFIKHKAEIENQNQINQHTFSPRITNLNENMFKNNPIENDALFKNITDRNERARILKKIIEVQKSKGINNIYQLRNIKELFNEEIVQSFNFGFDNVYNKDPISKKVISHNNRDFKIQQKNIPIMHLDVNIDGKKKAKLTIYENEDPYKIISEFSKKHGLDSKKRDFLKSVIDEKFSQKL